MITRRHFLGTLLAAPALAAFYGWRIEPAWTDFVRRPLPIRGLPQNLEGKILVQLSDLHVGDQVDSEFLVEVFGAVTRMQPEIVVYTGDFVSYAGLRTLAQLEELADRLPRGTLGSAAVLGNHDYGANWRQGDVADAVGRILDAVGCRVLRNEVIAIGGLAIGGVDDLWAGRAKLEPVFAKMKSGPGLMLCHNPDTCDLAGWEKYEGWIFAGHTHGGQCKPPFLPPPLLPVKNRRYTAGQFELDQRRMLYINRGLGHLLRMRFNVRPEVTVFEMAQA